MLSSCSQQFLLFSFLHISSHGQNIILYLQICWCTFKNISFKFLFKTTSLIGDGLISKEKPIKLYFLFQMDQATISHGSSHDCVGAIVRVHVVRSSGISLSSHTLQVSLIFYRPRSVYYLMTLSFIEWIQSASILFIFWSGSCVTGYWSILCRWNINTICFINFLGHFPRTKYYKVGFWFYSFKCFRMEVCLSISLSFWWCGCSENAEHHICFFMPFWTLMSVGENNSFDCAGVAKLKLFLCQELPMTLSRIQPR